jgi:hypothetical protein
LFTVVSLLFQCFTVSTGAKAALLPPRRDSPVAFSQTKKLAPRTTTDQCQFDFVFGQILQPRVQPRTRGFQRDPFLQGSNETEMRQ